MSWWETIKSTVGYESPQKEPDPIASAAVQRRNAELVNRKVEVVQKKREELSKSYLEALEKTKNALRNDDMENARFYVRITLAKKKAMRQCDKVIRVASSAVQTSESSSLAADLKEIMQLATSLNGSLPNQIDEMAELQADFDETRDAQEELDGIFAEEDTRQSNEEDVFLQQLMDEIRSEKLNVMPNAPLEQPRRAASVERRPASSEKPRGHVSYLRKK